MINQLCSYLTIFETLWFIEKINLGAFGNTFKISSISAYCDVHTEKKQQPSLHEYMNINNLMKLSNVSQLTSLLLHCGIQTLFI